jgi:hypothetical protein
MSFWGWFFVAWGASNLLFVAAGWRIGEGSER